MRMSLCEKTFYAEETKFAGSEQKRVGITGSVNGEGGLGAMVSDLGFYS